MANGHVVFAMITSQKNPDRPLDTAITDKRKAGLKADAKVSMKLFTLDHRLILNKIGQLASHDKKTVPQALEQVLRLGCLS